MFQRHQKLKSTTGWQWGPAQTGGGTKKDLISSENSTAKARDRTTVGTVHPKANMEDAAPHPEMGTLSADSGSYCQQRKLVTGTEM